jgi:cell division protease FtsH
MVNAKIAGRSKVQRQDIEKVFKFNQKRFKNMSMEDKLRLAYHEAGHYIIHRFAPKLVDMKVIAVSIVPAQDFYGVNVIEPVEEGTIFHDKDYFVQLIASKFGGRIGEEICAKSLSSGASADLEQATKLATKVVTSYGMMDTGMNRAYGVTPFKETNKTNEVLEKQIDALITEAQTYARALLQEHIEELQKLVDQLIKKGILSKKDLDAIF